jgi:outer membrane lipoprotein LolB
MGRKLPLTGVLLVLLLAACAQQPRLPTAASWEEHSARLRALTSWSAQGKLALRTPEQSESASIQWQQQDGVTRVYLSGPLGVAATSLYSDGKALVIRHGNEVQTFDLADLTALERNTGWDLPLVALPYWLKGLPAPELDIQGMELGQDDPALLAMLQQDDWKIHYEAYASYGAMTLPTKLQLQRRDTTVRLIIRDWQVAPG